MVSSRLYLNKGDMRFEDITQPAGVTTTRWATGAAMVDVNDDGYLDIYVCASGPDGSKGTDRANLLFINNGDRTFTEAAARCGLADSGFSTNDAFLDYDRDGALDLFLLNKSPKDFARGAVDAHPLGVRSAGPASWNRLYRNNGDGTFTDVSQQAGILQQLGYGLGVVVADVNRDGWPDVYVSNDVEPNDVLYINNGNGTFTNKAGTSLKHASFAGMGADIADFNNDGWPDIMQVDMLPAALDQRKRMSGYLTYGRRMELESRGFRDDFDANSLQLSNGVAPSGDVIFSDIATQAGVAATDWSWSALFADFDNDGSKDLFVTNGYPKAPNDLDYQMAAFGARQSENHERSLSLLKDLRSYRMSNYLFRNNGDLTFTDKTKAWGMDESGFAYGAAYADLNADGRLDIVINSIDAPAAIYAGTRAKDDSAHYLHIKLAGASPNRRGIGATLVLTAGGETQYLYHSPYRGYLSSMETLEHFGLGAATRVDTLRVTWPDGRSQVLTDLPVDQTITVQQQDSKKTAAPPPTSTNLHRFEPLHSLQYTHPAGTFVDYEVQPLLPYEPSRQGPPVAALDVNGDGLEDVFIGGASGVPGRLFLQRKDGSFAESVRGQPWAADKNYEDWGALFFDANGDGRPDLYVATCGYRLAAGFPWLQDRLYINQGGGRFVRDSQALPPMPTCTASAVAGDFTGDGRPDLFVGGRLTPRNYPNPTRSYLLRNDGGGHFTDVTAEVAPELSQPAGMITAAGWIDLDGDGRLDLVHAGQWMPVTFYHNDGKKL